MQIDWGTHMKVSFLEVGLKPRLSQLQWADSSFEPPRVTEQQHFWGLWQCSRASSSRDTHLVLKLLAELQGDGEEHQRIIKPRHDTFNLVNVAHFKPVVVELTVEESNLQQSVRTDWRAAFNVLQRSPRIPRVRQTNERQEKKRSKTYNIAPGLCKTELPAGLKFWNTRPDMNKPVMWCCF